MTQRDWRRGDAHSLGVFLNGEKINDTDAHADPIVDSSFLLLLNAYHEHVEFKLPSLSYGRRWTLALSTAEPDLPHGESGWTARTAVPVGARSILLLERIAPPARSAGA
jgi:glycogen operon protein